MPNLFLIFTFFVLESQSFYMAQQRLLLKKKYNNFSFLFYSAFFIFFFFFVFFYSAFSHFENKLSSYQWKRFCSIKTCKVLTFSRQHYEHVYRLWKKFHSLALVFHFFFFFINQHSKHFHFILFFFIVFSLNI